MNFVHYSNSPDPIHMEDRQQKNGYKPRGLWITPENQEYNWFDCVLVKSFVSNISDMFTISILHPMQIC